MADLLRLLLRSKSIASPLSTPKISTPDPNKPSLYSLFRSKRAARYNDFLKQMVRNPIIKNAILPTPQRKRSFTYSMQMPRGVSNVERRDKALFMKRMLDAKNAGIENKDASLADVHDYNNVAYMQMLRKMAGRYGGKKKVMKKKKF